jgi:hypothetical protein
MDDDALTNDAESERRQRVPRLLRAHTFVAAAVVAALIGGGLRLIPAYTAHAAPGASGDASTACAAK